MIMSNINAGIACHQKDAPATLPCKTSCVVLGTDTTNSSISVTPTKCNNQHAIFIFPNVVKKKPPGIWPLFLLSFNKY